MKESPKLGAVLAVLKLFGSLILAGVLLITSTYVVRFCMGLFMVGDQFILSGDGVYTPVATEPEGDGDTQMPTESQTVREVGRATVLSTGDLMMHLPIVRSGLKDGNYDFSYIYSYLKDYVNKADYAVVNLETTLSGTDRKEYTGYPKFNSPDAVASGAVSGGFDLLLTANNHCYDYGTAGMLRTLEVVKAAGADTLGTHAKAGEQTYLIRDLNGIKVGMLNYTYGDIGEDPDRPFINGLKTDSAAAGLTNVFAYSKLELFYTEVENQISAMRAAGAEVIMLYIHWGEEYTTNVNRYQKQIAQKMCDLGVDVIAGSHPHVVQTMELLTSGVNPSHQTVVLYSMGNFLSNQRADNISLSTGQSEDSVLFSCTFVKFSNGKVVLEDIEILPTWVLIRGSGNGRSYHILPLDKEVEDWAKVYDLTGTQSVDAHQSYSRTMDTLGTAYKDIRDKLAQRENLHELPTEAPKPTEEPESTEATEPVEETRFADPGVG